MCKWSINQDGSTMGKISPTYSAICRRDANFYTPGRLSGGVGRHGPCCLPWFQRNSSQVPVLARYQVRNSTLFLGEARGQ